MATAADDWDWWRRMLSWPKERGKEQASKSPFSLLFEPISPSSLNVYLTSSPSSPLFPPISPSSQMDFWGHFSLLPILFLPPPKSTFNHIKFAANFQNTEPLLSTLLNDNTYLCFVCERWDAFDYTHAWMSEVDHMATCQWTIEKKIFRDPDRNQTHNLAH